ncbi:MAG: hypothetical protein Q7O66_03265, partial [Dehalococcoidia bacterium]|nr:hypothetical protein [Dehalococcoidia bacterium]
MEKTRRTQIRAAVFGLVLAFIGLVMMINPFVLDLEELGFAIAFFGILVLTAGITTFVMYAGRARTMGNLMRDEGELVHWQYDALLWRQYVEAEFKEDSSAKTMLFLVGSGFALVIGIIFAVADPDVAVFMLLMMLSLLALMGFLAIVVPRVNNAIY